MSVRRLNKKENKMVFKVNVTPKFNRTLDSFAIDIVSKIIPLMKAGELSFSREFTRTSFKDFLWDAFNEGKKHKAVFYLMRVNLLLNQFVKEYQPTGIQQKQDLDAIRRFLSELHPDSTQRDAEKAFHHLDKVNLIRLANTIVDTIKGDITQYNQVYWRVFEIIDMKHFQEVLHKEYKNGVGVQYYAGIGSRETPPEIQEKMTKIASKLEKYRFVLRSGGAEGADLAFEKGVKKNKEIYYAKDANIMSYYFANYFHPAPKNLKEYPKKLMARNTFQILGKLEGGKENPRSSFVICWTPDGAESHQQRTRETGGTGQAISIASYYQIPIFNLKNEDAIERLEKWIKENSVVPADFTLNV